MSVIHFKGLRSGPLPSLMSRDKDISEMDYLSMGVIQFFDRENS